jgi:hypothetical protein
VILEEEQKIEVPIEHIDIEFSVLNLEIGSKAPSEIKILDMLTIYNVIDNIDSNEGKLDPYTQKVIRAVKTFINQVM